MKIYTRKGDGGETDLFGGGAEMKRVPKDSLRVEAIGCVDELNSLVGVTRAAYPVETIDHELEEIQKDLFVLGADLATPGVVAVRGSSDVPRMSEERVEELERVIDRLQEELDAAVGPMTAFILPGGVESAARLHLCRSVCRRAERVCVGLMGEESKAGSGTAPSAAGVVKYLNRLSDLFFVMARWENVQKGKKEVKWRG